MRNVWRPSQGLVISELDQHLFAFRFFTQGDKDSVLEKTPTSAQGIKSYRSAFKDLVYNCTILDQNL